MTITCPHCFSKIETTPNGLCSSCGKPYLEYTNEENESGIFISSSVDEQRSDTSLFQDIGNMFSGFTEGVSEWVSDFGGNSSESDSLSDGGGDGGGGGGD